MSCGARVLGARRMQPAGGVGTWVGAPTDRRPCGTVLGEVALAASATGAGRPVRSTVETLPTDAASPMLAPRDCKARLAWVLAPDAFAPSWACVAAALISGVAGIVLLPPQPAARIVAAIRIRRIVSGSPREIRSKSDRTRTPLRTPQNGRRPPDANHPTGLRNSAPRGGKVRRSENSRPWLGDSSARTAP